MAIQFHPDQGTILICDFSSFKSPEMTKRRPCVVISPRFRTRGKLCTVVPISTTVPVPPAPYHHKLHISPPLPHPYDADVCWVKADMVYTVSFDRLSLPFNGKDNSGKRIYDMRILNPIEFAQVQQCVLNGLGLNTLTLAP